MSIQEVVVELHDEIVNLFGSAAAAAIEARQALVLDLLREARISQGRAAELLGLTRAEMLDRMVERRISSGSETVAEFREELASLRRYVRANSTDGGN